MCFADESFGNLDILGIVIQCPWHRAQNIVLSHVIRHLQGGNKILPFPKGGPDRCSVTRGWGGGVSPEGLKISTILAGPASVQWSGTKFGTCT